MTAEQILAFEKIYEEAMRDSNFPPFMIFKGKSIVTKEDEIIEIKELPEEPVGNIFG